MSREPTRTDRSRRRPGGGVGWGLVVVLGLLHDWAIWLGMGGWRGLTGPWPLARHDHPIYFHSAWVTRRFLRLSGTTAGYDPYFMAGYAKSVVFPASSTLPELVVAAFGADNPVLAYKGYVLASAALVPWLVAAAGWAGRLRPGAIALSVLLYLLYLWTDFPISYVGLGMLPYFLAIPLGLLTTALIARFLDRGGLGRWLAAASASALVVLVHFTSAMVVAPAALLAYATASIGGARGRGSFPTSRHLGVWLIPPIVLAANAFWWWPGIWLASTKGESGFAFTHSSESLVERLLKIISAEPICQAALLGLGLLGLAALARRDRILAAGLGGLMAAGFGWGYLAAVSASLDFLQPGRHTYALYTAAALAAGAGLGEILGRLRRSNPRLDVWAAVGLALIGFRLFGPSLNHSVRYQLALRGADRSRIAMFGGEPFLSSRPPARLTWLVETVKAHLRPGDRLLYEEGGIDHPDARYRTPDPLQGGRFSGLLPYFTGVEVLGGPYLRSALTTNFTQFGGGELFGRADWDRDHFTQYARLYRPSGIVCWSRWARAFCRANPDLVEVLADRDGLLFGRVKGFGGATIEGRASVEAEAGRLLVRPSGSDLDGRIVLRYHSVPCLRGRPPARLEAVRLPGDPVPFIGVGPARDPTALELDFPP